MSRFVDHKRRFCDPQLILSITDDPQMSLWRWITKTDAFGGRPRLWQWCLPRYGHWGGPGWSAGRWNGDPAITDWSVPAVCVMDAHFREHDFAYQQGRDRDAADADLVYYLGFVRPDTLYGKFYRRGAMLIFTVWPPLRRTWKILTMETEDYE